MEQYAPSAVVKDSSDSSNLFELQVDHEVSSHLSETAKWAKFLSIVGFVFIGILVVMVLFVGTMASNLSPFGASAVVGASSFMQVFLLLAMVALYFLPCLFLFNFSNKMLRALRNNDQVTLIAAFRQLKLCFKYIGILTLIFISIYALVIVGALIMSAVR
jgi:hypothetical protein